MKTSTDHLPILLLKNKEVLKEPLMHKSQIGQII